MGARATDLLYGRWGRSILKLRRLGEQCKQTLQLCGKQQIDTVLEYFAAKDTENKQKIAHISVVNQEACQTTIGRHQSLPQ